MKNKIKTFIRRLKYGKEIVVVSGLPRSGTSMLMKMLTAGGIATMTDNVRTADSDNPKGYFELERVKNLERDTDKSWVREARGKAIKVISHLLTELPEENFYRIILAKRDLNEIIASQNIMLERRGEPNPVDDEDTAELYRQHLFKVKRLAEFNANMVMLEVSYYEALDNPRLCAERINHFIGGRLDAEKMASAVDRQLYRNRSADANV